MAGLLKLQQRFQEVTEQKKQLYIEINQRLQMDHHDDSLKSMLKKHNELKTIITQIEAMKPHIKLVESTSSQEKAPRKVQIGTSITIQYNQQEIHTYLLTAYGETNLEQNHISYTTELGSQLLHKKIGETFIFTHKNLTQQLHIIDIQYAF